MKQRKQLISIIFPCYNEEDNIYEAYNQIKEVIRKLRKYTFEIIFVDNGSEDSTLEKIQQIVRKDRTVQGIVLSRNFGPEISSTAGFDFAKGDAVLSISSDLQDPIELVPEYIHRWENGADIVGGIYTRSEEKFLMGQIRAIYYKIFKLISNMDITVNSSGITLFNRSALNAYISLRERYRSNIGLRAWIGFKTEYITYERRARSHGKSSYNLRSYLRVAERGFIGFSFVPLNFIIFSGLTILGFTSVFLFLYFFMVLLGITTLNSTVGIIAVVILFGGIQLVAISAIGKYIQVIVEETKQRPLYIVRKILKQSSP